MVSDVDEETMMGILRSGSPLNNMAERKIKVRAGSLHWFYDQILLNDLIDEARKTRIKDKSKFFGIKFAPIPWILCGPGVKVSPRLVCPIIGESAGSTATE